MTASVRNGRILGFASFGGLILYAIIRGLPVSIALVLSVLILVPTVASLIKGPSREDPIQRRRKIERELALAFVLMLLFWAAVGVIAGMGSA